MNGDSATLHIGLGRTTPECSSTAWLRRPEAPR